MAERVYRRDVERVFAQWVAAGREVGALAALDDGEAYGITPGSDANGIAWQVVTVTDRRGSRVPSLGVPYLGRTARTAHDVLASMLAAWRMIIDNERAARSTGGK
ncbi:hypothetical protein SEA_BRAXOADDIE_83 [Rhodococcus phage Braxoaddie]|nr:hypothetical protein SEA_BRAXOADDIE_83 [Rhodococcus phage Braxoaddie]WNM67466.1 hypothetical protein SEA_POLYYUKI_82 [Rhodococcus phage Polyyuki]